MEKQYKVIADVGDKHGGCMYVIAEVNSVALALMLIKSLKHMFGMTMTEAHGVLGTSDMGDLIFKGISLKNHFNVELETFY